VSHTFELLSVTSLGLTHDAIEMRLVPRDAPYHISKTLSLGDVAGIIIDRQYRYNFSVLLLEHIAPCPIIIDYPVIIVDNTYHLRD
jgi:maleate cis-trans isomerase